MQSDATDADDAPHAPTHSGDIHDRAETRKLLKGPVLLSEIALFSLLGLAHLIGTLFTGETRPAAHDAFVTAPIVRGQLAVLVTATGTVEPVRIVDVSTELSGTITQVHVEANQLVRAGQVLATLDDATWQQEHTRAKAVLAAAKARLHQAEAERAALQNDVARKSTLAQRRQTTHKELDQAISLAQQNAARIESQKAEIAVAEADLRIAASRLAKAQITAPIDGIVLRRNTEPGQTIAASLAAPVLFRLAPDLENMELRVNIDEADALRIRSGQKATFDVHALRGQRIDATVETVHLGPEIVQGVVTYKAILRFDNRQMHLRPGMTANADIVVEQVEQGLLVPNAALRFAPTYLDQTAQKPSQLSSIERMWAAADPNRVAKRQPGLRPLPGSLSPDERFVLATRGGEVTPIKIRVGMSDGNRTHVVGGDISSDQHVAVDVSGGPGRTGQP